jgi:phospholipid transport system substrate-binding protein
MTIGNSSPHAALRGRASIQRHCPHRILAFAIGLAMLIASAALTPSGARADGGAMAVTKGMVDQALQILGSSSTPLPQRRRQLRGLVEQNFDFAAMSRSALGFNWRSLSPDQRAQFTKLFTAFIEVAYLDKIQDYQGQQVRFSGQHSLGQGYEQVDTQIVEAGKSPISVSYLLEQSGGTWKIYDVTVEAISIIANYRNQFNRVIQQKGFDQLMADLQAKQQQLSSMLGEG